MGLSEPPMNENNNQTNPGATRSLSESVQITEHEWDAADHLIVTIVEAVADSRNTSTEKLPRLGTVVDVDAVISLLKPFDTDDSPKLSLCFEYADCRVTVRRNGAVRIESGSGSSAMP